MCSELLQLASQLVGSPDRQPEARLASRAAVRPGQPVASGQFSLKTIPGHNTEDGAAIEMLLRVLERTKEEARHAANALLHEREQMADAARSWEARFLRAEAANRALLASTGAEQQELREQERAALLGRISGWGIRRSGTETVRRAVGGWRAMTEGSRRARRKLGALAVLKGGRAVVFAFGSWKLRRMRLGRLGCLVGKVRSIWVRRALKSGFARLALYREQLLRMRQVVVRCDRWAAGRRERGLRSVWAVWAQSCRSAIKLRQRAQQQSEVIPPPLVVLHRRRSGCRFSFVLSRQRIALTVPVAAQVQGSTAAILKLCSTQRRAQLVSSCFATLWQQAVRGRLAAAAECQRAAGAAVGPQQKLARHQPSQRKLAHHQSNQWNVLRADVLLSRFDHQLPTLRQATRERAELAAVRAAAAELEGELAAWPGRLVAAELEAAAGRQEVAALSARLAGRDVQLGELRTVRQEYTACVAELEIARGVRIESVCAAEAQRKRCVLTRDSHSTYHPSCFCTSRCPDFALRGAYTQGTGAAGRAGGGGPDAGGPGAGAGGCDPRRGAAARHVPSETGPSGAVGAGAAGAHDRLGGGDQTTRG